MDFKTIVYGSILTAALAGGGFGAQYVQSFETAQMQAYQALATPQALASQDYGARAQQARDGLAAVAQNGETWAAQQQAQQ